MFTTTAGRIPTVLAPIRRVCWDTLYLKLKIPEAELARSCEAGDRAPLGPITLCLIVLFTNDYFGELGQLGSWEIIMRPKRLLDRTLASLASPSRSNFASSPAINSLSSRRTTSSLYQALRSSSLLGQAHARASCPLLNNMQRYSASQGYTSYGDDRHSGSIHVFQATPHSLPTQQMIPPSPNGVGAAGGAPIALSSHASAPVNPHQSFDTFDDIEWQWTSPTSVEHRHQHSHSQTQQQAPQPHGQHGQYAYGFSSPGNHNSFGPGSPQSPHQHAGVYSGSDGAGAFGPLSAPNSAVGSYSTSPPAISPLSSMPPPHESGYGPRSQQNQQSSILSSSLPVSMDYRLPNGSQFTFPSSPSPAHHQHPHNQTQAFGVSTIGAPNEWPSPTNTGQNDSLQSNGARPIRRRPIRKSESDTSYSSPAATAARLHLQRSMSGGGAHELNMNGNRAEGGNFIFMPSPSSPLSSPPPTLPMFLPNSGTAGAHKHSRSRSSGGSSSPGGGMLLSTSPTSPEIARAARGIATSTLTATRSSEEKSPNATEGMECRIYSDGEDEDGEAAKKRRKRDSRDGKEGVKVGNDSMSSTTAGGVTAMLLNATSTVLCSHQHEAPKKSLLQPPKASPSTWQIYFTDQLQLYRSRHPDQKLNVAQAAKELAQEYKRLSAAEREVGCHL